MVIRVGRRVEWGVTTNGYRVSFGGDENILEVKEVTIAQLCEYTKKLNYAI